MSWSATEGSLALPTLQRLYQTGQLRPTELVEAIYERIAACPVKTIWIHLLPRDEGQFTGIQSRLDHRGVGCLLADDRRPEHPHARLFEQLGDLNDYAERLVVTGDRHSGYAFAPAYEEQSAVLDLTADGFSVNLVERRPETDRWTLFHSRGPDEMHLCQLDYVLASPHLAKTNAKAVPDIVREGQPWRTPFPEHARVERYPRTGWDRPKASDHCPVAVTLDVL